MRRTRLLALMMASLVSATGLAQRAGAGGKSGAPPGGGARPQLNAEEAARAQNAKQWADVIDKVRAASPPPPVPQVQFATDNEKLLSRLRWAENPKQDLAQYLDKLWNDAKQPPAQRVVVESLWKDAERLKWTPRWIRPAIEDFYRKRSNGLGLRAPDQPAAAAAPPPATLPPPLPDATPTSH